MRRTFVVLVLALVLAIMPVAVAFAEDVATGATTETAAPEERDPFDDWYGQLNLRSGGLWNFETETWTPYLTVPILGYRAVVLEGGTSIDVDESTDAKGPEAFLLALSYNVGDLRSFGIDVAWAEQFGMNVGIGYKRSFDGTGDGELVAVISLIDLALDNGNVVRQRKR